jgi:predicted RNA polymerase sigma factor
LLIRHSTTATHETKALFALLLLHAGRLQARLTESGGLVLLDEQDRSTWDWSLIQSGFDWLEAAATGDVMSKYHVEAAIAAEHCKALTFEQTNWGMIDRLYELLYRMEPTAIHALNRAIALSYLQSPRTGIAWLSRLHPEGAPPGYHHWPAALGELHRRQGDIATAREYFEKAIAMSPPAAEREFLEKRLAQCTTP